MASKKPVLPLPEPVSLKTHVLNWCNCKKCPLNKIRNNKAVLYRYHKPECPDCGGTGTLDSGGSNPDGSWIDLPCPTCSFRTTPTDICFIGEAPGESEDITGKPFTGDSGRLLTKIINAAQFNTKSHNLSITFTNILACFPPDPKSGPSAVRPPEPSEATACQPRLEEFIISTQPRAVILVGKTAAKFFPRGVKNVLKTFWFLEFIEEITHPAALLRAIPSVKDTEGSKIRMKLERLIREMRK